MKDFYDIYILSRQFSFEAHTFAEAIRLTFKNRDTEIPTSVLPFTKEFIAAKEGQWRNFHKKLDQEHVPIEFSIIVESCERFLSPISKAIVTGKDLPKDWVAPGPWAYGTQTDPILPPRL